MDGSQRRARRSRLACTAWPPNISMEGAINSTRTGLPAGINLCDFRLRGEQDLLPIQLEHSGLAGGFEHTDASHRGADAIPHGYGKRPAIANRCDETGKLRVVAFLREE